MAGQQTSDTIAAIATPPGTGGIGIVRISGSRAPEILQTLFHPHHPHPVFQSHFLYYGTIQDSDGSVLDEVLAVYMKAPRTYTTEDVVEIHCHGSHFALQAILGRILSQGARLALPGEFTKRAFLGGRIDLTRAEAVIDLLQAKSQNSLQMAVSQLRGGIYQQVEKIRGVLVAILAVVEVAIDFPDDDVEIIRKEHIKDQILREVEQPLRKLIEQADQGKVFREGAVVVIAGRPNVGKSSLLNALLQEERALVTPIPGTTRDTIEEYISVKGVPVRLVDTAGIRDDADTVEALGIRRARSKLSNADLVLLMIDGSETLSSTDMELYQLVAPSDPLIIVNKIDIEKEDQSARYDTIFSGNRQLRISAKQHHGLNLLQDAIYSRIVGDATLWDGKTCAPNIRHRDIFEKTLASCAGLRRGLEADLTADLIAIELQTALDHLADIVGITTTEDVLETIFTQFCLGK